MKITEDSIGNMTLDEFVRAIAGIYKEKDEPRSIWDIWLHATHHAASIGEEARKYKPGEELFKEIADFAMWLFTFVGKINEPLSKLDAPHIIEESTIRSGIIKDFSDIIWNKYPGLCPICFFRRIQENVELSDDSTGPCDCFLYPIESRDKNKERDQIPKLDKYAQQLYELKPNSVNKWQEMFREIFKVNLRHLKLADIAFHLLEEVGEVSDAMIRMYTYLETELIPKEPYWRRKSLENEIADVSSWVFTLVNHLEIIPKMAKEWQKYVLQGKTVIPYEPITLAGIIWYRYGDRTRDSLYCPHKKEGPVCQCPIILINDKEKLKVWKML